MIVNGMVSVIVKRLALNKTTSSRYSVLRKKRGCVKLIAVEGLLKM